MSTSRLRSAICEWRARPEAALFPALLHSLTMGFNGLPVMYFLRELRCAEYAASLPQVPPDIEDLCRSATVQKAYSADMAISATIVTVMGIALSGPYGTFSDLKGRKRAMLLASSLNMLGDTWLVFWALYSPLHRPWILFIASVLSGLGGEFSVLMSAHNAFIADTTPPTERSRYLGLSLVMLWAGTALGPLVSGPLTGHKLYAMNFALTSLVWVVYVLYVVFVLRETRVPAADRETSSILSVLSAASEERTQKPIARLLVRTFVEPLRILATRRTMLFPALGTLGVFLAAGVFTFIIPYCDWKFGLSPSEAGVVSVVTATSRALAVVVVLPAVLAAIDKLSQWRRPPQAATPQLATDEQTPLLPEARESGEVATDTPEQAAIEPDAAPAVEEPSVVRELTVVRVCLVLDAVGMIFLWRSRNALDVNLAVVIGALGAPATPSMQALVTIAAPQDEMGRVLAGVSILESLAVALRSPVFFPLFHATLERMPGAIFWLAAAIFLLSDGLMMFLRSRQYTQ